MNPNAKEIMNLIIQNSAYYGQKLEDIVVRMYAEDLSDLPLDQLKAAFAMLRRDPKITRMPLPAVVRATIKPSLNPDDQGREIAAKIISAIKSCGWTNPAGAAKEIGEIGMRVVDGMGGWTHVCETVTSNNQLTFQAQCRDLASTYVKRETFDQIQLENNAVERVEIENKTEHVADIIRRIHERQN